MSQKTITLVCPDDTISDAHRIADFLFLFQAVYLAAYQSAGDTIDENPSEYVAGAPLNEAIHVTREYLRGLSTSHINKLFELREDENRLIVERISYQSPLEFVLRGSILALTVAVILSGGEAGIGPLQFECKPVGEGIGALRQALSPRPAIEIRYGINPTKIKLSRIEYDTLMHHLYTPTEARRGGFQRKIFGYQNRINRKTHEIELSPLEIEWIIMNGSDPNKGGWQGTLRVAFGRHLPFPL
jgi:hypothetical protein